MGQQCVRIGMAVLLPLSMTVGGCVARREPMVIIAPSYSHVQAAANGSATPGLALTAAPTLEGARY